MCLHLKVCHYDFIISTSKSIAICVLNKAFLKKPICSCRQCSRILSDRYLTKLWSISTVTVAGQAYIQEIKPQKFSTPSDFRKPFSQSWSILPVLPVRAPGHLSIWICWTVFDVTFEGLIDQQSVTEDSTRKSQYLWACLHEPLLIFFLGAECNEVF